MELALSFSESIDWLKVSIEFFVFTSIGLKKLNEAKNEAQELLKFSTVVTSSRAYAVMHLFVIHNPN